MIGDGVERNRLELYATQLGIQASVHFLGQRTDIPELLSCVDVSILSSLARNFPALNLGIYGSIQTRSCHNVGFLDELVQHEETGFLVQPGDTEGLAESINKLIMNPTLSSKMGEAGDVELKIAFLCKTQ